MTAPALRTLVADELAAVVTLQQRVYAAHHHEGEAAYADRLADFPAGCLGLFGGPQLIGYAIGLPWTARRALPLAAGRLTGGPAADVPAPDTLYVHDVAVDPDHRGEGLATQLVLALASLDDLAPLTTASLVAVQGAAGYWRRLGFVPLDVELGAGYGGDAAFMEGGLDAVRAACRRATGTAPPLR